MAEAQERQAGEPGGAPPATGSIPHFVFVRVPYFICGVILLTAIAINISNVVGRYVFDAPVSWAEEVLSYMIIWGVFIAVGAVTYQGLHLKMDLFVLNLHGIKARFIGGLTVVLMIVCAAFVIRQSLQILQLYWMTGETSMGARVPLIYPHAALLVGFSLMLVVAVVRARAYWNGKFD
jgi:TRAP-type C4-dicarboxylate transport system permease small subunit